MSNTSYKFKDFGWLKNGEGFGIPSDVYYGSIYLGVIESQRDGYVILVVSGPDRTYNIKQGTKTNKFKNKQQAAERLHWAWRLFRNKDIHNVLGNDISDIDNGSNGSDDNG